MGVTRNPKQKRSLEKKKKILEQGFRLFCECGYHKTTTTEIARAAGISTGALYSYYADKKDIFIEAFEDFFDVWYGILYEKMEAYEDKLEISGFTDMWIDFFTQLYRTSNGAIAQLSYIMADDEEISRRFAHYEDVNIKKVYELLEKHGIGTTDLTEKIYLAYMLVDGLGQLQCYPCDCMNLDRLEEMIRTIVTDIFK